MGESEEGKRACALDRARATRKASPWKFLAGNILVEKLVGLTRSAARQRDAAFTQGACDQVAVDGEDGSARPAREDAPNPQAA